ncbi:MAG: hypothetical protein ACI4HL_01185 [Ruminococcus sp.]
MTQYLHIIYTVMWFIIAIGVFCAGKKYRLGITTVVTSAMFLFMGIWWLVDTLISGVDFMSGTLAWVFRGIIALFVVAIALCYIQYKKSQK